MNSTLIRSTNNNGPMPPNVGAACNPQTHTEPSTDSGPDIEKKKNEKLDANQIRQQIFKINDEINANTAAQIALIVQFDELEGWRENGSKNCIDWMNSELGIDRKLAWERLRVGRELRNLPIISALFKAGHLGWSKVRILTRIADAKNEKYLSEKALDSPVSDLERLSNEYRWTKQRELEGPDAEATKAKQQFDSRRLTWNTLPNENIEIRIVLAPDQAQLYLKSLEQCEDVLFANADEPTQADRKSEHDPEADESAANDPDGSNVDSTINVSHEARGSSNPTPVYKLTAAQRRADAAVLMAEQSLARGQGDRPIADRYQVVLDVDVGTLLPQSHNRTEQPLPSGTPESRPVVRGIGATTLATAERIMCDASFLQVISNQGEPLALGRKTRLWSAAQSRAIHYRDKHCQFPGCSATTHLQIHHLRHWINGGHTSVVNGVCVCAYHHKLLHEGGFEMKCISAETVNVAGTEPSHQLVPEGEATSSKSITSQSISKILNSGARQYRVFRSKDTASNGLHVATGTTATTDTG